MRKKVGGGGGGREGKRGEREREREREREKERERKIFNLHVANNVFRWIEVRCSHGVRKGHTSAMNCQKV